MELKKLDSKDVNTNEIIKVYEHNFTKFVENEPNTLDKAIDEIELFLAKSTPKYKQGKDPIIDSKTNKITYPGEEQIILYQFDIKNKNTISQEFRKIDKAMKVIPFVAMEIRNQLKQFKTEGTQMNLPSIPTVPTEPQKPGVLERLGFKDEKKSEFSKADKQIEILIEYVYEIRDRWGYWKEWFYGAIAYDEDRVTWSDIYPRSGTERLLTRLQEFFDYWIVTRFLPIHEYAMDMHLEDLTENTNEFVKALARMQHESEQANAGNF